MPAGAAWHLSATQTRTVSAVTQPSVLAAQTMNGRRQKPHWSEPAHRHARNAHRRANAQTGNAVARPMAAIAALEPSAEGKLNHVLAGR